MDGPSTTLAAGQDHVFEWRIPSTGGYPIFEIGVEITANTYADQTEGELASFALAQLLAEQGLRAESQAAFRQYLETYPTGQFVAEVRRRVHQTEARDHKPLP